MKNCFVERKIHYAWAVLVLVFSCLSFQFVVAKEIQKEATFRQTSMSFDGKTLVVNSGKVSREWKLTSCGLQTIGVSCNGRELAMSSHDDSKGCDWDLGGLQAARLVSLTANKHNDDSFTSEHLQVVVQLEYPREKLAVRYVIWAYPGAPGLRTQLQLKAMPGFKQSNASFVPGLVESIHCQGPWESHRAFGLMQGIKTNMNKTILKEQTLLALPARVGWANGLILQGKDLGMMLVKESNKHTALQKNDDVATGAFIIGEDYLKVTGCGIYPADLKEDRFRTCWATWLILFEGDELKGNLALKEFDRLRYPIDPERDIYILANTWGTEDMRPPCLHAAREENVLRELESVAELGIDVLQIDDGWQTPKWTTAVKAEQVQRGKEALKVFGNYDVYPEGWKNVRKKAETLGVTLGLWAAWTAPLDALKSNYDLGNFKYFKLDFARLHNKDKYDNLAQKARELIKHSDYTARVNWDVTEVAARMGYFSGREYGNIYLANRKTKTKRDPVLYVPYKVLNEAWKLSKYLNLNKFQVTVQNVDHVPPNAKTDAGKHSHDYAIGISLMSSPIFFQETRHYKPSVRKGIRDLIAVYKNHRRAMYSGYVFPIGREPNNRSWTGFQNHNTKTGKGYLTLFRELRNQSSTGVFHLHFLEDVVLNVTNLMTNESYELAVGNDGEVKFEIPEPAGFLYLSYEATPSQSTR